MEQAKGIEVLLADWGYARETNAKKTLAYFRGCPPYSHDAFLGNDATFPVEPKVEYASLAYTIDHVMNGNLRWHFDFDRPNTVTEDELTKRRDYMAENDC